MIASVCLSASADVIHLKNGEAVRADHVQENATTVEYEIGDNSYTIPKDKVLSVEVSAEPDNSGSATQLPVYTPRVQVDSDPNLLAQVVRNGEVDRGALLAIESRHNAAESALGYYLAAKAEFESGRFPDSRHDFEVALRFQPDSPAILTYYAALLVRTGNAQDAISYAQRAARIVPDSPDALGVLGYAQFAAGRLRDATESWKKSLALRPDNTIRSMLDRAHRESRAETNYSEQETGHFVLRFEGSQSSKRFREQLLATLESQYRDLSAAFGGEPRASIQVVLYTSQTFFDVTRAPSWTGALNDGKLRIPLHGVDSVTPELARVLHHELTHSFVNQLTNGRCPSWLNEGLAQLFEPRSLGMRRLQLAQLFKAGREVPLNSLEHGFASLSTADAALAYDESLAVTSYIATHYGTADLIRVLQRLGQGDSAESSLRAVLHTDYGELMDEVGAELARQEN